MGAWRCQASPVKILAPPVTFRLLNFCILNNLKRPIFLNASSGVAKGGQVGQTPLDRNLRGASTHFAVDKNRVLKQKFRPNNVPKKCVI